MVARRSQEESGLLAPAQSSMPQAGREIGVVRPCFTSPQLASRSSLHAKEATGRIFGKRTIVFLSASGGVGLSTLCSLTALELKVQGKESALVDADFDAGGLDVLLGLENDKGLRFGMLDAPLGNIDGEVLRRQLPQWEGVPVLAFDSWNSEIPEWWEVKAVLNALGGTGDVVLVDGAHGRLMDMIPGLRSASTVVAVELSVLGLARAKALLNSLALPLANGAENRPNNRFGDFGALSGLQSSVSSHSLSRPYSNDFGIDDSTESKAGSRFRRPVAIVGIETRGMSRRRGVVDVEEAGAYLGREVIGPICPNSARTSDSLEGLGLKIARSDRTVLRELTRVISESVEGDE